MEDMKNKEAERTFSYTIPCVVHSLIDPARGTTPLSTLIPGMMPLSCKICALLKNKGLKQLKV